MNISLQQLGENFSADVLQALDGQISSTAVPAAGSGGGGSDGSGHEGRSTGGISSGKAVGSRARKIRGLVKKKLVGPLSASLLPFSNTE